MGVWEVVLLVALVVVPVVPFVVGFHLATRGIEWEDEHPEDQW